MAALASGVLWPPLFMGRAYWVAAVLLVASSIVVAAIRGARGIREGRGRLVRARLTSPTPYLFAGYLLVAALVSPTSPGESASPLLLLAIVVPIAYALAALSAVGDERPPKPVALALALLHAGSFIAAAAIVLALVSPAFVPSWLR
jgi:hypothetical protein